MPVLPFRLLRLYPNAMSWEEALFIAVKEAQNDLGHVQSILHPQKLPDITERHFWKREELIALWMQITAPKQPYKSWLDRLFRTEEPPVLQLDADLRERLIALLESLNLRGQRCPICMMPRIGDKYPKHAPDCDLMEVLTALRKARNL